MRCYKEETPTQTEDAEKKLSILENEKPQVQKIAT